MIIRYNLRIRNYRSENWTVGHLCKNDKSLVEQTLVVGGDGGNESDGEPIKQARRH